MVDKQEMKQKMVDKWSIKPSLAEKMVDIFGSVANKDENTTEIIVSYFGFTPTTTLPLSYDDCMIKILPFFHLFLSRFPLIFFENQDKKNSQSRTGNPCFTPSLCVHASLLEAKKHLFCFLISTFS